jgi:ABC-2 type transport system permease protein
MLLISFLLIGLFFAMAGVLVGLRSEKFDDLSLYQTFILQPLIFLGGVFYSVSLLPEPFHTITHFNPIYYMINTVRYGMLGSADVNPTISLALIAAASSILLIINYNLFKRGYKLRA